MTIEKKKGRDIRGERLGEVMPREEHEALMEKEWVAVSDLENATLQELAEIIPDFDEQLSREFERNAALDSKLKERVVGWAKRLICKCAPVKYGKHYSCENQNPPNSVGNCECNNCEVYREMQRNQTETEKQ